MSSASIQSRPDETQPLLNRVVGDDRSLPRPLLSPTISIETIQTRISDGAIPDAGSAVPAFGTLFLSLLVDSVPGILNLTSMSGNRLMSRQLHYLIYCKIQFRRRQPWLLAI